MTEYDNGRAPSSDSGEQICICLILLEERIRRFYSGSVPESMLYDSIRNIEECIIAIASLETGDDSYDEVIEFVKKCRFKSENFPKVAFPRLPKDQCSI